ncbi:unnamed protein product [Diabrotica balteata]|uniref:Uncharacterized protein n=1 Tax=Diabrotica balteata TaxID=107213 RepID=A0A9N9T9Q7_DIABA|nr:unnamed protein product [Diabrotica balteata]
MKFLLIAIVIVLSISCSSAYPHWVNGGLGGLGGWRGHGGWSGLGGLNGLTGWGSNVGWSNPIGLGGHIPISHFGGGYGHIGHGGLGLLPC